MRILRYCLWVSSIVLVMGCANKPVVVDYSAPVSAESDWYVIPADAPQQVEMTKTSIPRLSIDLPTERDSENLNALIIVELKDSVGNSSLRFNRNSNSTWELIESALQDLNYTIADKDRGSYRFFVRTGPKRSWLYRLLSNKEEELIHVVLIPQLSDTFVVVEGDGDEVLTSDVADAIFSDLKQYFQTQR